ncbi:cytochrome-b5 reductase [Natronocella acetinitrilica]|uniref:Cytochrome-b5 reductase n=1 Tax=Natronocella acetinitrilica TaxID=414046 RepID=A0AAE3G1X7_9GAMM|nr:oxidoreductase-like domain-containing protein [Natronocella acetinitrilica]MCP1673673.1 cytochrome-b5 reductase [Natronocella acetinitrilica]
MHDDNDLPPPPEKPDPQDCCGSGCIPCILEVYEDELEAWREKVAAIKARRRERTSSEG